MTAYALARGIRPTPIYDALLEQDQIRHRHISRGLEQLTVRDAMTSNLIIIPAEKTPAMALERIRPYSFSTYAVIDKQRQFLGLIPEARIRRSLAEKGNQAIGQLTDHNALPFTGLSFDSCCHAHERDEDAAVARTSTNRSDAAGWTLSMIDIVRAQAVASKQVGAIERTATPPFAEERETLEG